MLTTDTSNIALGTAALNNGEPIPSLPPIEPIDAASVPLVPESASDHLPPQADDTPETPAATAPASKRRVRLPKLDTAPAPTVKRVAKAGTKPAVKPAGTVTATKPAVSVKPAAAEADLNERAQARIAAVATVAAYYTGTGRGSVSFPFKAAADIKRLAPLNFGGSYEPTRRNAAALAAILAFCAIDATSGTFERGSGRVPGALLGHTGDDAKRIYSVGPESGTISGMLGGALHYVSGELSGAGASQQLLRIDYATAESLLRQHNDKLADGSRLFAASLRQLASLRRKAGTADAIAGDTAA